MVVKPIAFVMVAALVVVAAGTGAYVAMRQNGSADPVPGATASLGTDILADPGTEAPTAPRAPAPVDATEEILTAAKDDDDANATDPARDTTRERRVARPPAEPAERVSRRSATAAAETRATTARDPVRKRPTARDTRDLPEVKGWTRVDDPSPNRETPQIPDQVALAAVDRVSLWVALDPEERPRIIEALVLSADSVIGLQIDTPVSSEDAKVEDDVQARVTRDVVVGDEIAVPAGTRVMGSVVLVESAGKIRGVSRLGVRFHTVVMDDGAEVPMVTQTIYREGKAKGGESAAKIGGAAIGGAILGAIFGGRQGAAIGGAAGAAGGTAMAVSGDAQPATLPAGATVTVRLSRPSTVMVER